MIMHVNLSPEMEGCIKGTVAGGFYGNATEVIRDAIRRMQTEESRVAAWQAAIAKGDAQLDRGEDVPYTPELMERMTQSAIATMHNGQPIDPDVPPKPQLKLSPEAQKDFTSILRYTGERWGHDQLLAYRDKLNDVITMLDRNPQLGHQSRELPDTHRLYFAGSHVIVYRTRQDATEVMRTCISAGAPRGMYRALEAKQCGKSIVS